LIGATHPSSNPRLVREADSLAEAGHEVRVVAPSFMEDLGVRDSRLLAGRDWTLESFDFRPVGWTGRGRSFAMRGRRKLAQSVFHKFQSQWLAEQGYTLALRELGKVAARKPADWFIAHAHGALPIASRAAKRWHARLGFDCEDLLTEFGDGASEIVRRIEEKYLPLCDYVSVPSKSIGEKIAGQYGIRNIIVLYNVFPTRLAKEIKPPAERPVNETVRLHWFGQTIGAGRGLEEAVAALQILNRPVELHLRGCISDEYRRSLEARFKEASPARLIFHEAVDHDQLIGTMGAFDIGLALERAEHIAYANTVTNKLFTYLLAGLAVAATDTPGTREVMGRFPQVGFLYTAGDPNALAAGLRAWIDDPQKLHTAKQQAWEQSRQSFCWDIEQEKFFAALELERNGTRNAQALSGNGLTRAVNL
jgi:glycosyltransferase involved in cell wall biosynthesis